MTAVCDVSQGAREPGRVGVRHRSRLHVRRRADRFGLRRRARPAAAVSARGGDASPARGRQERVRRKADGAERRRLQGAGRARRVPRPAPGRQPQFPLHAGLRGDATRCRERRARHARSPQRQLAVCARPDPVRPVQQLDPRLGRQPALRTGLASCRVRHRSARPARRGGGGRVAPDRAARQSACLSALECRRPKRQHLGEPEPVGCSRAA